jgi:hypothetical protein
MKSVVATAYVQIHRPMLAAMRYLHEKGFRTHSSNEGQSGL